MVVWFQHLVLPFIYNMAQRIGASRDFNCQKSFASLHWIRAQWFRVALRTEFVAQQKYTQSVELELIDQGVGLRRFFEILTQNGCGVFAESTVFRTKRGEEVAVDIQFTYYLFVNENGHDDFRFGF